jgi:hypothetical protein
MTLAIMKSGTNSLSYNGYSYWPTQISFKSVIRYVSHLIVDYDSVVGSAKSPKQSGFGHLLWPVD